jgi:hypothetical protein
MLTMREPPGVFPDLWQAMIERTGAFLDRWGAEVVRCGWDTLDVFGADKHAPDRRFDCMGIALLLRRCEVTAVDEHGADLVVTDSGTRQRFYRQPLPWSVPLWEVEQSTFDPVEWAKRVREWEESGGP